MAELVGLEWRTARSGKDTVDHSPGVHDDVASAAAGALALAGKYKAATLGAPIVLPGKSYWRLEGSEHYVGR